MKKLNLMAVAAGLLILGTPAALRADDASDNKPADKPTPELRERIRSMTPEQRQQWMKDHPELAKRIEQRQAIIEKNRPALERAGVNFEEMKGLTPAERREKVQPLVDKRIADLEKKKTDGTGLTEQEDEDLKSLKQLKAMAERNQNNGPKRHPKATKPDSDDNK